MYFELCLSTDTFLSCAIYNHLFIPPFSILDTALPLIAKIELENGDGTWSSFSEFTVGDTAYGEVRNSEE